MGCATDPLPLRAGQVAGVLGLGLAGRAAARFLASLGLRLRVSDQRSREQLAEAEPGFLDFLEGCGAVCEFGGTGSSFLDGLDLLSPAPGVPLQNPLVVAAGRRGIPIMGELALAAGRFQAPVIAVTGSNGKTTTTGLIGHLLKTAGRRPFVGGNIGAPLLDCCLHPEGYDCVVLELSSFQLDISGAFRPNIGLFLNLTPDHLDRHGSLERYAAAKRKLFARQGPGDTAILGIDDALVAATKLPDGVRRLSFGRAADADCVVTADGLRLASAGREQLFPLAAGRLHSLVNRLNAAAALLAVGALGIGPEAMAAGLASFQPAAHRMAPVALIGGVSWIDDSKATNIGAMAAALASCPGRVVLIAGGRDKGGDYGLVADLVRQKVRTLVLLGEAAPLIEAAYGSLTPSLRAGDMHEAVHLAKERAQPGDTVLLAPGCSSFDMFSGYAERGRVFAEAVLALKKAEP